MACYFSLPTISRSSLRASFQLLTLFKSSFELSYMERESPFLKRRGSNRNIRSLGRSGTSNNEKAFNSHHNNGTSRERSNECYQLLHARRKKPHQHSSENVLRRRVTGQCASSCCCFSNVEKQVRGEATWVLSHHGNHFPTSMIACIVATSASFPPSVAMIGTRACISDRRLERVRMARMWRVSFHRK